MKEEEKCQKIKDHVAKARPWDWVLPQCLLLLVVVVSEHREEKGNFRFTAQF